MSEVVSSISPAKYWRETQNWPVAIGQTCVVVAATLIYFGLPELNASTPYWLVLVKHTNQTLHLYLGADGYTYHTHDLVVCMLRRLSSSGNGLIHYGIKVIPTPPATSPPRSGPPKTHH